MLYTNSQLNEIVCNIVDNNLYGLYEEKIKMFSDFEQSILWQCMNDKIDKTLHVELDKIIRKHISSDVPVELYRGVSKRTEAWLKNMAVGRIIADDRVTSFTSDFSTARQFAGGSVYGTHTILSLRNCPFAFNYQEHALNMLLAAPDTEFMHSIDPDFIFDERLDKLEMVNGEDEWMFPIGTQFEIVEIEELQYDPLSPSYTVYHLDFYSF
ncbi:hypothetical protein CPTAKMNP4_021 [Salmonella phage vB_SenM-AKM_NP4]|uniref:NAD--protein ADP-ribosyltransferase modB n=2 Tax=Gelderlandvirus TaxID=1913653 RepID=M1EB46_BPS16|nr:RNA polymerase ADP-ribosylase [Salmonella phage vB_SenM-S16]YP_009126225.1 RNA polymerase ADP-ribosylase [Salmonella phage STP4-a]UFK27144.1 hypothetical protein LG358_00123 [Escherichia phage UoN_LG358_1]WDR21687.1 hypothetical protein PJM34_0019 [Salmonella phage vB_SenM_UTK0003]WLI71646.1 hypothetical protein CPTAKMNP4_021 [Salmonella phage vB_SenM-AKM_NP4]AEO97013.1 ADP-rybosylase [Salmonella phage vB_SenM-S16]AHJ86872.1 ADP-ribosylase [Salmonella phage STP4-a]